ncbi:hypothetical protein Val02_47620 [Virgisporangium aliadipatigenens]|uniref:HTH luxR-type domain-containing protein n=2 Tax=Virgisporangium aliadipatigenens TaxID=741659 RepID=A0A8J4DS77_9ACTN|nr:hypothetical protein Val02_47620 [Virgisporangium aliadipatigenens]
MTPTGDPVMAAKLRRPDAPPWTVPRTRLFDRVARAVDGPLTLISAPAGTGKTVLMGSWLDTAPDLPHVWLNVGDAGLSPGVFWSYILAGFGGTGKIPHLAGPTDPDTVERSLLVRLAATLSELPQPLILVLDHAEALARGPVPETVEFLLTHAAPQLRLVVLTRTDPALPLHRYRMDGSLTELRLADLAFDEDETRALLAAHDAHLTDSAASALGAATRGWAAGLRLAARALRRNADPARFLDGSLDGDGDIAGYFGAEVLDAQTPSDRDFLLRTSLVDELPPGLAAALSGRPDADTVLARLAHANTFTTTSATGPRTYGYHPLVREVLRTRLRHEHPDRTAALHRTAARWYADAGRLDEAAHHAANAGDWADAAAHVVADLAVTRLCHGPRAEGYAARFAAMPPDIAGPEAAVVHAALALRTGDTATCGAHLASAERLIHDESGWPLRLCAAALRALHAAATGDRDDMAATACAASAAALLTDATARGLRVPADVVALVRATRAEALLRTGDLSAAADAAAEALDATTLDGARHLHLDCLGRLALVEALRGHLRHATELAHRAEAVIVHKGQSASDLPPAVPLALAWVHTERCDPAAARRHRDRAAAHAGDPICGGVLAAVEARLRHAPGDGPLPRPTPAGGEATLTQRVESWLATASAALADRRFDAARDALERALRLAEPEKLRRPVAESPAALRRFLRHDRRLAERHAWLGAARTGGGYPPRSAGGGAVLVVEPLTEKEREVLRYLSELFSTEEIARTMFVSVNTVKTHVRGVLRKLSATRRNEAVRRARELGLV